MLADAAARDRAADRDAVQHPGRRDVVDVQRLAGDLRAAFLAARRSSDERDVHWLDLSAARLRPRIERQARRTTAAASQPATISKARMAIACRLP